MLLCSYWSISSFVAVTSAYCHFCFLYALGHYVPHLSFTNYCVSLPLWEGYWKVIEDIWSRDVNSKSWDWRHLNISFVVSCPSNIFLSCLPCSSIFNCISFWTWMENDPTIAEICRLYQCLHHIEKQSQTSNCRCRDLWTSSCSLNASAICVPLSGSRTKMILIH